MWNTSRTNSVCEEREEAKEVELQEDTNMSDACIKGFNLASFWGS